MKKLFDDFEELCVEERDLLIKEGVDADVQSVINRKEVLFKQLKPLLSSENLSEPIKIKIDSIKKIQAESELLYVEIMSKSKKIIQKLNINRNNLGSYKIKTETSAFLDHSG